MTPQPQRPPTPTPGLPALPGPLVDAGWLAGALGEPGDVVVADVRWYLDGRSGLAAFEAGHIPGARWVDVDADLAAPPGPGTGRHPLPTPPEFAAAMGRHGIAPTTVVVAYDDVGGSIAARLWWMLRQLARPAAVLDGGIGAWVAAGGALEPGPQHPAAEVDAGTAPAQWPEGATVGTDGVRAALQGGATVLDARTAARYRGDAGVPDQVRGHIPGACSAPWQANLDPATGRFLPPGELRARFEAIGAAAGGGGGSPVIASCGSGVTACHDLLALELAGLPPGALYPGSWSAWSSDPSRPVAIGPAEPGGP